ncbi:MAG: aminotransferase class V-fold PLP-dependent enzyme [Candidatus Neomarinimicrobiota bacterium]
MADALDRDILSISHRGEEFKSIYAETEMNLRQLLNIPDSHHVLFLSSATEAMERIIQNCVGDRSHHLVNGAFAQRFQTIARQLGKTTTTLTVPWGSGFDFDRLDVPADSELIAVTQNETSTGVALPETAIAEVRNKYPEPLLAVDIVSSVPFVELDYTRIDAAFFSVQKGFGLPAGLGVLIINGRCLEKSRRLQEQGISTGSYHCLEELVEKAGAYQNPETPNVLGIYLLGRVCRDLLKTGIATIRAETNRKADLLYRTISGNRSMAPFVAEARFRSPTVIVARTSVPSAGIIETLAKAGFKVGAGYGKYRGDQIRIANFPAHSPDQAAGLAAALADETGGSL